MPNKKQPRPLSLVELTLEKTLENVKDPTIQEQLKKAPMPEVMKNIIDSSKKAVYLEDKLSETSVDLFNETFKLTWVYGFILGENRGLTEARDTIKAVKEEWKKKSLFERVFKK